MKHLTAPFVVMLATIQASIAENPKPKTPIELVGFWVATEILSKGVAPPREIEIDLEFTQAQMLMHFGDHRNKPTDVFNCFPVEQANSLNLDLVPAYQTRTPDKQTQLLAIYKVEGDTLRICTVSRKGSEPLPVRPTEFVSTPESGTDLIVLKRRAK